MARGPEKVDFRTEGDEVVVEEDRCPIDVSRRKELDHGQKKKGIQK